MDHVTVTSPREMRQQGAVSCHLQTEGWPEGSFEPLALQDLQNINILANSTRPYWHLSPTEGQRLKI